MFKVFLLVTAGLFAMLLVVYLLGPKRTFTTVNNLPSEDSYALDKLDGLLASREATVKGLKPDNAAEIVWNDSIRQTAYSFVYIHGFSASHGEGNPVHRNVARHFGANLYLTRLPDHGVAHDSVFQHITPQDLLNEARSAVAVGKSIGKKTILMSCSTGGTLSLYLSAGDPEIHAEILLSPNIALAHPLSRILNDPWGLQLARRVGGSEYNNIDYDSETQKFWTNRYRWEGTLALQELLEMTMQPETFHAVTHPIFCGYYFKDSEHQDPVISVDAILKMEEQLGTSPGLRQFKAFANGTDHVMLSPLKNPNWKEVEESIIAFCEDVLQMPPARK